jgi:ABC-type sugar transport system ATPase subunit
LWIALATFSRVKHPQRLQQEDFLMGVSVSVKRAVKGFALDVARQIGNELAVLFGFSGSGKSLTPQLVAGLERI